MASSRLVVIDDTDLDIRYIGNWFQDLGSQDQMGNLGTSYLHTLHGTSVDGTVEFEFNGTAIEVFGTTVVVNATTTPDPTLKCFVDGVSIDTKDPFAFPENNWNFCGESQLLDGHHTLRIDVQVLSQNQTFWLDQLRYAPSPNLPLDNQVIYFDNMDPAIQYDPHWTDMPANGFGVNMTRQTGSSAQVNFIGTSVSWLSVVSTDLPHPPAIGTWAIDGGEAVQFNLPGITAGINIDIFNQYFFTTPEVEAGSHTLTVTFLGNNQTTPLSLDYLYVKNGTFLTSNTTSASNTTTTPNQKPPGSSGLRSGVILGGVLGGLAFLVITTGSVLFWKRRKARQKKNFVLTGIPQDTRTPFDFNGNNYPGSAAQHLHQSKSFVVSNASAPVATPPTLAPPAQQQLRATPRKMRGRAAVHGLSDEEAGRVGHTVTGAANTSVPLSQPQIIAAEARQHVDSGIRLGLPDGVPPHYTPL